MPTYRFANGYGASVIADGYGRQGGLLELAVIKWDGDDYELVYNTPITDGVIGWLTAEEVRELLDRISALTDADIRAHGAVLKQREIDALRREISEAEAAIDRLRAEIMSIQAEVS